jgi:hypothetical protein
MKCYQRILPNGAQSFVDCPNEATHRVWCPTWLSAEKGPIDICEKCSRIFDPMHNKYATDGTFYWGANADKQFKGAHNGN